METIRGQEGGQMPLQPSQFPCRQHQDIDLTELVTEAVNSDPTIVTNYGFSRSNAGQPRQVPFLVMVQCPGHNPDGSEAHNIDCEGTFVR
jgi:hypothetical protein